MDLNTLQLDLYNQNQASFNKHIKYQNNIYNTPIDAHDNS